MGERRDVIFLSPNTNKGGYMKPLVYVIGRISDWGVWQLRNIREGLILSDKVWRAGAIPLTPFTDFLFEFLGDHSTQEYYELGLAYVKVADAVMVRKKDVNLSRGSQEEIAYAKSLGKPIFYDDDWEEFEKWLASR